MMISTWQAVRAARAEGEVAQKRAETAGAVQESLRRAGDLQAQSRWPEALEAAQHAEALFQLGGGSADLSQCVQAMVADLKMLRSLEDVRLEQTGVKDDHFDTSPAESRYAAAFRDYGVDVDNLAAAEAGVRLGARPIHIELAAALDDWAHVRLRNIAWTGGKANWKHLLAVARAADPDASRNQFRDALERSSGDRKVLEDLAASADIAALPASTLVLLGHDFTACRRCQYGGYRAAPGTAAIPTRLHDQQPTRRVLRI